MTSFNENDEKYRCCCGGKMHVVLGTKIWLGLYIGQSVYNAVIYFPFSFFWIWIPIFIIVCTFIALHKETPALLWPFIIIVAIGIGLCLLGLAAVLFFGIFYRQGFADGIKRDHKIDVDVNDPGAYWTVFAIFVITLSVLLVLAFWEIIVLLKCKKFYQAKHIAVATQMAMQPQHPVHPQNMVGQPPGYPAGMQPQGYPAGMQPQGYPAGMQPPPPYSSSPNDQKF